MKKLKMKSLKYALLWAAIFWVFAGVIGFKSIPAALNVVKGPISWDEVDFSGDIEGLYVTGTLYGIYDYYCEEVNEDNETLSREYLIDADDEYYIAMRAEGDDDMAAADALMEACWAYMDGEDDGTLMEQAQYEITGVITAIPEDSMEFFYQYLEWDEMSAEDQEIFLPYYIDVNQAGSNSTSPTEGIIMAVLSIVFLICGAVSLIWVVTGRYQKSIKKYLDQCPNEDVAREKVERFFETTEEVEGLRYNEEFISGQVGATTVFGEIDKIVWIYLDVTTHKRNFITVRTDYKIAIGFADGDRQFANAKNEESAKQHIQKLAELCPQAILGYSDELNKMFNKDLNGFLKLRYQAAEEANSADV